MHPVSSILTTPIAKVPVRLYLHQLLWFADVPNFLTKLARSAAFKSWTHLQLRITAVPAALHHVSLDMTEPALLDTARLAYKDYVSPFRILSDFDDHWRENIVEPVVAQTGQRIGPGADPAFFDLHLHSECAMIEYLQANGQQSLPYLGTSELSCLPCWDFLRAYNVCVRPQLYVRGHHGGSPLRWAAPALRDDSQSVYDHLEGTLGRDLVRGMRTLRMRISEKQRAAASD